MNEQRGYWYLLTGLVLGLAAGLLFSWYISPVEYIDTDPSSLADPYQAEYRRVIALAYQASGNLERARERMQLLGSNGSVQILAAQAQRMLAENQSPREAQALAILAADLGRPPGQVARSTSTPIARAEIVTGETPEATATGALTEAPPEGTIPALSATPEEVTSIQTPTLTPTTTPTHTPNPTFTPRPTATPIRALDAPFVLKEQETVCEGAVTPGLLQVEVFDSNGEMLPGVKISVAWQEGESTFYTGLAPEISAGYADFVMQPGVTYSLTVGDFGRTVEGITVPSCGGSWIFRFEEGKQEPEG